MKTSVSTSLYVLNRHFCRSSGHWREAPGSRLFDQLFHCYWDVFLNKCAVAIRLLWFIHRNISQLMNIFLRMTVKGQPRGHETLPGSNNLCKHFETQICRIRMHREPPKMFYSCYYNNHKMVMTFKKHQCWRRISNLKTAGVRKETSEERPITIIYFRFSQELVVQVLITVIQQCLCLCFGFVICSGLSTLKQCLVKWQQNKTEKCIHCSAFLNN